MKGDGRGGPEVSVEIPVMKKQEGLKKGRLCGQKENDEERSWWGCLPLIIMGQYPLYGQLS